MKWVLNTRFYPPPMFSIDTPDSATENFALYFVAGIAICIFYPPSIDIFLTYYFSFYVTTYHNKLQSHLSLRMLCASKIITRYYHFYYFVLKNSLIWLSIHPETLFPSKYTFDHSTIFPIAVSIFQRGFQSKTDFALEQSNFRKLASWGPPS